MSDDGIDFQPAPTDDGIDFQPETKPETSFGENLLNNAGRAVNPINLVKGIGSQALEGLYEVPKAAAESAIGLLKGTAKAATTGKLPTEEDIKSSPIVEKTRQMTEPIAKDPGGFAYKNPLDAAGLLLAGAGMVSPFLGGAEGAEAASGASRELPVTQPGAKTGDPHALFAYNDEFGQNGQPRSLYNIYGDPEHPAIQQAGGHGSSVPADVLEKSGIPITGREPRSVGKWEPIESAPPTAKDTIGKRLAARTTAQALDINPLAARKLAAKAGMSPEDTVLDLGNKANDLIPNLIEATDSANSKFTKILNAHDQAGAEIGKLVDDVTKGTGGAFPEAGETIKALRDAAENYYQVDGGDLALAKTADRLESLQKAGNLDFDRLSKVKSAIGKGFNKTEVPAGTEDIYGILSDGIDKVINRLEVHDPSLGQGLGRLKQIYTVTSRLIPAMSRTAAREVAGANVGGGVFSKMIPSAVGGAIGGVPGALIGGGAKYLQEAIAPDLGKNLAFMAMKAKPEVVAAIQRAMPGITAAQAELIASRINQQKKEPGMFKGGRVPDDVRQYVSKPC